jgi:hypothetical protein
MSVRRSEAERLSFSWNCRASVARDMLHSELRGSPAEYKAGLDFAIDRGLHALKAMEACGAATATFQTKFDAWCEIGERDRPSARSSKGDPPGAEREGLLRRIREIERIGQIVEWIYTPALKSPT